MMIDKETQLSDAQAITATAISTDVYDLGEGLGNLGAGEPLKFQAVITTAFNNLTSIEVQIVAADDAALSTNAVVVESKTILLADAVVGARFAGTINMHERKRYIGFKYVVVGTAPTTGAFTSFINFDVYAYDPYPANYVIQTN